MSNVPNHRELLRALKDQGWGVDTTARGHFKATPPAGGAPVVFCESDDPRGMRNNLAQLRRGGFEWPPSRAKKTKAHKQPPQPPSASDLDALFEDLKAARGELTAAELKHQASLDAKRRAEEALAEAERSLKQTKGEVDAAERLVQEAKALFDMAFEARV